MQVNQNEWLAEAWSDESKHEDLLRLYFYSLGTGFLSFAS